MPIGNLTSQLFANVYLDALDHFVKENLRVRHYLRYMDDFLLLVGGRREARERLVAVRTFLTERLRLELNPRRVIIAPIAEPCDLLGYVHHGDGRVRVRHRSVRRLWGGGYPRCSGAPTPVSWAGDKPEPLLRAGSGSPNMSMPSGYRGAFSCSGTSTMSANACWLGSVPTARDRSDYGPTHASLWRRRSAFPAICANLNSEMRR